MTHTETIAHPTQLDVAAAPAALASADHYVELISAALEIHRPRRSNLFRGGACVECSGRSPVEYPCRTALALGVPAS